nr:glycosyltransferase [Parvularcula mediterranea]
MTIVIPALDEEKALPRTIRNIAALDPQPDEVILVDGGSTDRTREIASEAGFKVIEQDPKGRARQINRGVAEAQGPLVMVLHADTMLPEDACKVVREVMEEPRTVLAGFTAILEGDRQTRWITSLHNWAKTWYAPLLFRPHLFFRGCRLLFGDHAMFFRKTDFEAVGGCDPEMMVMEEADLCVKMTALGRVRLIDRLVRTDDRRVAAWGGLKANLVYANVGIRWGFGARKRLGDKYPDVR